MIIECCSQERSYSTFYGLIGERFCKLNRVWNDCFEQAFGNYYTTIHRYETNRLRNIARFFGHLVATDSVSWAVLECIKLTEDDTTSSSRIFIKIMMQEVTESMGLKTTVERFKDEEVRMACRGMFPMDNPKDTRFAINYFTSVGLGAVTEEMREHLKVRYFSRLLGQGLITSSQNAPRIIMEQRRAMLEAESSDSDSDSDDDSSSDSDSDDSSDDTGSDHSRQSNRRRRSPTPPRRDRGRDRSRTPPRRRPSPSPPPRPRDDKRPSPSPPRYRNGDRDARMVGGDRDRDGYRSRYDAPPHRRAASPPDSRSPPPRGRYDSPRRRPRSRTPPKRERDYDRRRDDSRDRRGRDDPGDRQRSDSRDRYRRDSRR